MNFVGCAEYRFPRAHTLDLRGWHSEGARDRWRDQDGFQTPVRPPFPPPLLARFFPSLSFSPGKPGNSHGYVVVSPRYDTTRYDTTRHDTTTAKALKPANLFLLSFHATRLSRTPLHLARRAPLDNVADKVARNVAGVFYLAHE